MVSPPAKFFIGTITGIVGAGLATYFFLSDAKADGRWNTVHALQREKAKKTRPLPSREELIETLKTQSFDIVIIGGGATGAGCALDAVTRGLKTALIEADDFASGTSSKSTKLIHGGVRYLQKAIMQLDIEQYRMVKEALHERGTMLNSAPHLTHPLPIMLPVYAWWKIIYYWAGIKMYDFVAGSKTIKSSYLLSKKSALELFPMLRGDKLCCAIVYYDGQLDDARMNLAVALTAIRHGATVVNHVSVSALTKGDDAEGKIRGVKVKDEMTGKTWSVPAKCVVNATGPFTDTVRKMDDPNVEAICSPSSGVHITLPGYYSPEEMGLLDPATSDGRVIFFLPWQKHTIAGTTDLPCEITHSPKPTEGEIEFILEEIKNYLNPDVEVRRSDVLSAWSGIRPLVSDPNKPNTQSLARNHVVHVSASNLVTVAGGKWTTYRAMAQDTIDAAIKACNLCPFYNNCQTHDLLLEGAHDWTPTMYIRLVQDCGLEPEVAKHLSSYYGDEAFAVAKMAAPTGKRWPINGKKIHPELPYIDAQIRYGVRAEYALNSVDMIARRLRLAFLNVQAALEALPEIVDIMAEELDWNEAEKRKQIKLAKKFLQNEMGHNESRPSSNKNLSVLNKQDMQVYIKRFQTIDRDRKGYVFISDIKSDLKNHEETGGDELDEILKNIKTKMNGQVGLDEYLQIMSTIKPVTRSGFAKTTKHDEKAKHKNNKLLKKKIPVERSGGGL